MFRTIRKKKNEISTDAAKTLLQSSRRGVLAVNGDDGYPYAIPINYVYDDDAQKIYFHGARVGHKVDALRACDKVCFTVYGNETIKEEDWAPFVQSVVVFGREIFCLYSISMMHPFITSTNVNLSFLYFPRRVLFRSSLNPDLSNKNFRQFFS